MKDDSKSSEIDEQSEVLTDFKIVNKENLAKIRARQAVNSYRSGVLDSNFARILRISTALAVLFLALFITISVILFVPDFRNNFLHSLGVPTEVELQAQADAQAAQAAADAKAQAEKEAKEANDFANMTPADQVSKIIFDYFRVQAFSEIPEANSGNLFQKITSVQVPYEGKALIAFDLPHEQTSRAEIRTAAGVLAGILKGKVPGLTQLSLTTTDGYYVETIRVE